MLNETIAWNDLSKAQQVAQLPPDERAALFADMSDAEWEYLEHDWTFWGRPQQQPPWENDDWDVFLMLAGRGAGKTRPGSEIIHHWAANPGWYLALIGETAAEVRDVMIDGESGLLATQKPWNRCTYEPSKRRVVWENGSWATCFSGDSPDQLRGPNCHGAWCLVGQTPVLMADGTQKNISSILPGDMVQTRNGPRRVISQKMTQNKAEVYKLQALDRRVIIGTGDHPVWVVGKGFLPLSCLQEGDRLCVMPVSHGKGWSGISAKVKTTIVDWFSSIAPSGNPSMAKFQKTAISITSMGINSTIVLKTCNWLGKVLMRRIMQGIWQIVGRWHFKIPVSHENANGRSGYKFLTSVSSVVQRFLAAPFIPAGFVLENVWISPDRESSPGKPGFVNTAEQSIRRKNDSSVFAPVCAMIGQPALAMLSDLPLRMNGLASNVKTFSPQTGAMPNFVGARVPYSIMPVVSVKKLATLHSVFNITVEDTHEFFANGILTHNCDELAKFQYASDMWNNLEMVLRAGDHPRVVVSTTPRPIPLLKDLITSPRTVVRRYSTYANMANLAPTFLRRLLDRYEGTRIGRQEIHAEVLEDHPDALWNHTLLDMTRVTSVPELDAVAIGIDPPGGLVTECGIVASGRSAAGLGSTAPAHGYALADRSTAGKPEKWARTVWELALWAAETYDVQPWLIPERNHGGEMVRSTLETARPSGCPFRIELVHASQGKAARAEPVVMLYEQQRYHHVGTFPALEDEMTQWSPHAGLPSPNRLDALVWSAHGLKLVGQAIQRAGAWGR